MQPNDPLRRAVAVPNARGLVWDPERREMRRPHNSDDDEPESLNEVTNELPPLTDDERQRLGYPPRYIHWGTNDHTWGAPADQGWGAPTTGGWDLDEQPPRPDPDGTLSVVRSHPLPTEKVAILLLGESIVQIGWNRLNEIMLPFPGDFLDMEAWPNMPDLSVATYAMSTRSREQLRAFQQIFAWFPRPCSIEGSDQKIELWRSLLERVLSETSVANFNPADAVRRILEFARSILPHEVWDIVVSPPGHVPGYGWGDGW